MSYKFVPKTLVFILFHGINCYSGAYNLQTFLDLGFNSNYSVPQVQPDEGCIIQFTSVSMTVHRLGL